MATPDLIEVKHMSDGTALSNFQDFVLATKPHKITPTTEILNDTAKNYYLLGDMLKGKGDAEVVQNGKEIIDMVRLKKHTAAGFYKPNEILMPKGMDVLTKLTAPWRFHAGNFAWTDEEVDLNGGGSEDNWVRLLTSFRQAAQQDIWDSLENSLFATPDTSEMESADGTQPYSIPTFITTDGLAPAGFTTIEGVNPSTQSNWRNQVESYTAAAPGSTLYTAFDRMWMKLNWSGPSSREEWFQSTRWRKMKILTDTNGVVAYTSQNRDSNDRLIRPNDASYQNNPTYNNIPLTRISTLDEKAWANPYYYWLDSEYIFPIFHTNRYMDELDPIRGSSQQPFSWVVYTRTYMNLFCRSRKRQGIINPV
jgi:hypothetical protein